MVWYNEVNNLVRFGGRQIELTRKQAPILGGLLVNSIYNYLVNYRESRQTSNAPKVGAF